MSDHEPERQAIREAMGRLLDGNTIRSDGKLTITSLADEADVKRWILTHRHQDLQAQFRSRIPSHGSAPQPPPPSSFTSSPARRSSSPWARAACSSTPFCLS